MVTCNQQNVLRYFMVFVNTKFLKPSMYIYSTSEFRPGDISSVQEVHGASSNHVGQYNYNFTN